jgi:AcrR family transcriptional regulator
MSPNVGAETFVPKGARENVSKVIDAATRLFRLKGGFDETTMEMIAKEAEIPKPGIFALFRSKEEIVRSCFDALWFDVNREIDRIKEQKQDVKTKLRDVLKVFFYFLTEREKEKARLYLTLSRTGRIQGRTAKEVRRFIQALDELISDGQRDKAIRTDKKVSLIRDSLFAEVEGMLYAWILREDTQGDPDPYPGDYELRDVELHLIEKIDSLFLPPTSTNG